MTGAESTQDAHELVVGLQEFTASMAAFPTGVTIVTTLDEEGLPVGLTCNAFMSVSVDPPLVLVSVDRSSNTLPALQSSHHFVVNFLAAGREALALHFAGKSADKFAERVWAPSEAHGLPVLHDDSVAHIACEVVNEIEAGDHILFLGRVYHASPPEADSRPLLYYRRTFDRWPPE
ncbi:MAG TPA: flavin reductase family protein [Gaiellaceae bacterium]|nr:flavin reductase family protein [Gaiellaceae bacterium]